MLIYLKSKLPFRVLKLLETASFRERHVHFVRLTVTTAPMIWASDRYGSPYRQPDEVGVAFTKACRFKQLQYSGR